MTGVRVFLLVFAACAVAALVAALVGGPFVSELVQRVDDSAQYEARRGVGDAKDFARAHEQADCVPEALRRLAACGGFWCRVGTPGFAKVCLGTARPSPALCDEVPQSFARAALWPTQRCLGLAAEPQVCRRIYSELVMTCTRAGTG